MRPREKGPDAANIQQVVDALREAHHALVALATQEAGRASELATLLAGALAFTEKTGDATCPVCETPEVLTKAWRSKTTGEIKRLRESAKALKDVDTVMGELKRAAQAQCASVPPWLADPAARRGPRQAGPRGVATRGAPACASTTWRS